MTISVTTNKVETIEKEISLPYQCRLHNTLYSIQEDKSVLVVNSMRGLQSVCRGDLWLYEQEIAKATEISYDEFKSAMDAALCAIHGVEDAVAA